MTLEEQKAIQQLKQGLMQSQHQVVISGCNDILRRARDHVDLSQNALKEVLYLKAVAYRLMGNVNSAIDTLNELIVYFPNYARAFQELGYCYLASDQKKAAHSFYQATRFNPALLTAWLQLEKVYKADGQSQALALCQQQIAFLTSLPKPLLGATDLMHEGQLHKAEQVCRQFLASHEHHPEAMMLLAEIGIQLKVYSDAEFLLESCVTLYPENDRAAAAYQNLLSKLGKFPDAAAVAKKRLEYAPDNFTVKVGLAHALVGVGELDEAINVYKSLLSENEDRPAVWVALGHALKARGDIDEAIQAYETAIVYANDFGDAYWSLANTKTYRFSDELLTKMVSLVDAEATKLDDEIHICFALGKGFEDSANATRSFAYYERGNRLKKRTLQFDIAKTEKALQAQQQAFTKESFDKTKGCQAPDPIFIVGLPRAGSTLLEQILASHSQVDGTMELHDILGIASSLSHQSTPYPLNVSALQEDTLTKLGEQYLRQTRAYRQGAPFFIDKMPNNFIHIGLIKKILPNAKIIDARRNPMDCCFSGFKQLFGEGQEFSYSLDDIGRYYNAYEKLMAHWHNVLPDDILTVQHEEVLDDLEGQVKRILAFCGLAYEEACLAFHQTKRIIKTPSSEQVRQPIYKTGMGQWKPFESNLEELKNALCEKKR
ncbi:tetratricopeptide repeat protein [Alteromonas portus]|uniref:Tetratricopeptide repeat protein n=1 Tax=Alteromonas portus TaxID=2565549 RepID=A0A4V5NRC6_9ALTE|nr:tetratricopeptide repeat-containing sulfotransferase family protein [Alteromonas portus]TKB04346.1 tetratricopeptide repeat protein [Alteromonas portus]